MYNAFQLYYYYFLFVTAFCKHKKKQPQISVEKKTNANLLIQMKYNV